MNTLIGIALLVIGFILNALIIVILVQVVLSWLISFQIVGRYNPIVDSLWRMTNVILNPLLRPIRRIIPALPGFDLAPMVLRMIIYILQLAIPRIVAAVFYGQAL